MACPQKEISRGTSPMDQPVLDLTHCRCSSMNEISEKGTSQMCAASLVRSSNASSGGVSSTWNLPNASKRTVSSEVRSGGSLGGPAWQSISAKLCLLYTSPSPRDGL